MNRSGNTDHNENKIEKESTIYIEILKGRGMGSGHACTMDFDGNKGLISKDTDKHQLQNHREKQVQQKINGDPFLNHYNNKEN